MKKYCSAFYIVILALIAFTETLAQPPPGNFLALKLRDDKGEVINWQNKEFELDIITTHIYDTLGYFILTFSNTKGFKGFLENSKDVFKMFYNEYDSVFILGLYPEHKLLLKLKLFERGKLLGEMHLTFSEPINDNYFINFPIYCNCDYELKLHKDYNRYKKFKIDFLSAGPESRYKLLDITPDNWKSFLIKKK